MKKSYFELKNLNKNNIYKILKKYKLVRLKNLSIFSHKTRDNKNLKSFIDKKTNIIFLGKTRNEYYYKNKKLPKDKEKYINTCHQKLSNSPLHDAERRINQFRKFIKNKVILDFGCGTGDFLIKGQKIFNKGVGVEINSKRIEYTNIKKINFLKNINEIDNLNIKFDTIFLFHVFEHLIKPEEILLQLKSKLKRGGQLIIEVPHANDYLLKKLKVKSFINFTLWSEHLILHTKKSLNCFLKKAGFKKNKVYFYQRYNLNNHMGWLVCDKPGGHTFFKNIFSKKENYQYSNILTKKGYTDTIFSISKN